MFYQWALQVKHKRSFVSTITKYKIFLFETVNMDGTALYEAVAVIFIAQLNGRILTFTDLIITRLIFLAIRT